MAKTINWERQIGRRIKLWNLQVFLTAAHCGSMGKAAATLGVSQPTVSDAVAALENTFGVRLLDRGPRGVEPTAYGGALLKHSVAVFDELKQSRRDIESLADPSLGEISIGCLPALSTTLLSPLIERFGYEYPRVVLHVDDVDAFPTQIARLRDRKYDLILSRLPQTFAEEDDLKAEVLYSDGIVLTVGMSSRLARRRRVDLAELVNEPWLLPASHTWAHALLAEAFHGRGVDMPRASVVTVSVPLRLNLLASGRYITAFSRSTLGLHANRYDLKALPVDLPGRPWPVLIVTLKNRSLSPAVERFLRCARDVAKSIAKPVGRTALPTSSNVSYGSTASTVKART